MIAPPPSPGDEAGHGTGAASASASDSGAANRGADADGAFPGPARVAEALSRLYGRPLRADEIRPGPQGPTAALPDGTAKFRVPGPDADGPGGFCILSGAGNPDLIARAADNIAQARTALPDALAAPVLEPLAVGRIDGRAFAVWPEGRPLGSGGPLLHRIRRRRLLRPVAGWCVAVAGATATPGAAEIFAADLGTVASDRALPDALRRDADAAMARLRAERWRPVHCLHHGDFWEGNLLLPPRGGGWGGKRTGGKGGGRDGSDGSVGSDGGRPAFLVIDWAGMRRRGYPFLDLARMLISLRAGARFSRRALEAMCAALGCGRDDAMPQLLAGIGHVGRNLEHFPPPLYRRMATELHGFVRALV